MAEKIFNRSGSMSSKISLTCITDSLLEEWFEQEVDSQRQRILLKIHEDRVDAFLDSNQAKASWSVVYGYNIMFELIFGDDGCKGKRKMAGIRIVTEEQQRLLWHNQPHRIMIVRDFLQKKLSQQGFQQQFRPYRKIGKGNFGSVYLAERIEDGRKVAVKAFSKEASYSQDKGRDALANQISVLRRLAHRNIVELIAVFQSANSIYVVMEMIEGGQLMEKLVAQRRFSKDEVRGIMQGLLKGLAHMHVRRIMHRDLKPENLLFRQKDKFDDIVIADFGLSCDSTEEEHLFIRCGTPGYVAPEVINIIDMKTRSEPICDIFSAGVIFHILMLGRSVFVGKTYDQVLRQNRLCLFKLQGPQYKSIDQQGLDLMKKMLQFDPNDRISAAEALKHPFFQELNRKSSSILKNSTNQLPIKSEILRKNSINKNTPPLRLSLSKTQSRHEQQLQLLKDLDKENMQPMGKESKIRKKVTRT